MDSDNDGLISAADLRTRFTALGEDLTDDELLAYTARTPAPAQLFRYPIRARRSTPFGSVPISAVHPRTRDPPRCPY